MLLKFGENCYFYAETIGIFVNTIRGAAIVDFEKFAYLSQ